MIEEPTVLVLGAGASQPYGYPVGTELRDKIINNIDNMLESNSGWVDELGFSKDLVSEFNARFLLSGKYSIDSFLSHQNEEFVEIGKMAIVDVISTCESYDDLFDIKEDNWYTYLLNKLSNCSFDEINNNKLTIITFNYDRSLEHFLFTSIFASYNEKYVKCASQLKNIPIVHMYGRLDDLPYESKAAREYESKCSSKELKKITQKINLIYEAKDIGIPKEADKLLEKADNIYFLGLDLRNTENLKLFDSSVFENKNIFGTTYKLKEAEINQIKSYFTDLGAKVTTSGFRMKTLEAIRNYAPLK